MEGHVSAIASASRRLELQPGVARIVNVWEADNQSAFRREIHIERIRSAVRKDCERVGRAAGLVSEALKAGPLTEAEIIVCVSDAQGTSGDLDSADITRCLASLLRNLVEAYEEPSGSRLAGSRRIRLRV